MSGNEKKVVIFYLGFSNLMNEELAK